MISLSMHAGMMEKIFFYEYGWLDKCKKTTFTLHFHAYLSKKGDHGTCLHDATCISRLNNTYSTSHTLNTCKRRTYIYDIWS